MNNHLASKSSQSNKRNINENQRQNVNHTNKQNSAVHQNTGVGLDVFNHHNEICKEIHRFMVTNDYTGNLSLIDIKKDKTTKRFFSLFNFTVNLLDVYPQDCTDFNDFEKTADYLTSIGFNGKFTNKMLQNSTTPSNWCYLMYIIYFLINKAEVWDESNSEDENMDPIDFWQHESDLNIDFTNLINENDNINEQNLEISALNNNEIELTDALEKEAENLINDNIIQEGEIELSLKEQEAANEIKTKEKVKSKAVSEKEVNEGKLKNELKEKEIKCEGLRARISDLKKYEDEIINCLKLKNLSMENYYSIIKAKEEEQASLSLTKDIE